MLTNNSDNIPTGASNTVLQGQGVGTAPAFSTATYPATTTSQQILYSTAANVVGQLTTANSSLPATNSSGTLAMRALSVNIQVFTSTGTYTPTSGMLYCIIECVGGGGGGGGTAAGSGSSWSIGGGGGGGGYSRKFASAATIGASQSVTIGAAGSAGTAGNNAGGNGGDTSVGSICIGKGGTGGGGGTGTAGNGISGGAGGVAGTGDFTVPGQQGGNTYVTTALNPSGYGGASLFGFGGAAATTSGTNAAGNDGQNYGGGGSGGLSFVTTAKAGGAGVKGLAVVTEFVIA